MFSSKKETSNTDDQESPSFLGQLEKLYAALDEQDDVAVLELAPRLLKECKDENDHLIPVLTGCHATALLAAEKNQEAANVLNDGKCAIDTDSQVQAWLDQLSIYAKYKSSQEPTNLQQVVKICQNHEGSLPHQHLLAQALHHLHQPLDAVKVYEKLLADKGEDDVDDLWVNGAAVLAAHYADPVYGMVMEDSKLLSELQSHLKESDNYDLLHNAALLGDTKGSSTKHLLNQALLVARRREASGKDIQTIEASRQGVRNGLLPGSEEQNISDDASSPLSLLCKSHQAVATALSSSTLTVNTSLYPATPHHKWSPVQVLTWWYTRGVLYLRNGDFTAAMNLCNSVIGPLSGTGEKAKKKVNRNASSKGGALTFDLPWTSEDEPAQLQRLIWYTRFAVLKAHVDRAEKRDEAALKDDSVDSANTTDDLRDASKRVKALHKSSRLRNELLGYLTLHQRVLKSQQIGTADAEWMKDALPASWLSKPAVRATLGRLAVEANPSQNEGLFPKGEILGVDAKREVALWTASCLGDHETAARKWKDIADETDEPADRLQWIRALSHVDPKESVKEWNSIRGTFSDVLNHNRDDMGTQLETRPLPKHLLSRANRQTAFVIPLDLGTGEKKKKSSEAVLRRRARQREAHLDKLKEKGTKTTDNPDPERWIPKYERHANVRRRNRSQQQRRSAQGTSVDDRLDVLARKSAAPSNQSTAHMNVVGGGYKGRKAKGKR